MLDDLAHAAPPIGCRSANFRRNFAVSPPRDQDFAAAAGRSRRRVAQPLIGGHDLQAIAGYVPANARHSLVARGIRMGTSTKAVAALALNRFGLGPRLGSIAAIAADPRGALLAELDSRDAGRIAAASLPTSAQAFRLVADANAERRARAITMALAEEAKREDGPALDA